MEDNKNKVREEKGSTTDILKVVIKVIGVGGGGSNIANQLAKSSNGEVEIMVANTDAQHLDVLKHAKNKIQIGIKTTGGLGCGADPEQGKKAIEESREEIKCALKGADLVFITVSMGGGTGTGASSEIAKIAKEVGALVIGVTTKPFTFEGTVRSRNAEWGINNFANEVDSLIVIPNNRLLEIVAPETSLLDAFKHVDIIASSGVSAMYKIINVAGLMNVDFADVVTVMAKREEYSALSVIGVGEAEGQPINRAIEAAERAISSPLIDGKLGEGTTRGVLINITGGPDMTLVEINSAMDYMSGYFHPDADIIHGAVIDEEMMGKIRVTAILTRIEMARPRLMTNSISKIQLTKPTGNLSVLPLEGLGLPKFKPAEG